MRWILPVCLVAAATVSGCAVRYSARADSTGSATTSRVGVSSGSPLGNAIIIGVMAADAVHYDRPGPDGRGRVPEPDPERRINAQDCTRPVDPYAGNLLCR
jgi:hypothetical protein